MAAWYTATVPEQVQRIRGAWADAPVQNLELLGMLLDVARGQVLAFAPVAHSPVYEPARVEWPTGEKVTLTREGDVVTAYAEPGGLTFTGVPKPLPAEFSLQGSLQIAGPGGSYVIEASEYYGIRLFDVEEGPYLPTTGRWLATPAPGTGVPPGYVLAQLMQVRNLWNAGRTSGEGVQGAEGFTFRPYPLDNTIKAVIRPIDWKPDVH